MFLHKTPEEIADDARRLQKAYETIEWCKEVDRKRQEEFNKLPRFSLMNFF